MIGLSLVEKSNKKLYQTGNFDTVIRHNPHIKDNEVLIEVDGDDYLPDRDVFTRINRECIKIKMFGLLMVVLNILVANLDFLKNRLGLII